MGLVVGFTAGKYLSDDNLAKSTTTKREENVSSLLTADQVGPILASLLRTYVPLARYAAPLHAFGQMLRACLRTPLKVSVHIDKHAGGFDTRTASLRAHALHNTSLRGCASVVLCSTYFIALRMQII